MTLAHEVFSQAMEVDEEELAEMVSREELRTMVDQVAEMYEGWDKTQLALAQLHKNHVTANARQVDLEARMALLERNAASLAEHGGNEITERRTNVRMPVRRAAELIDKEKEAKVLSEMLARYQWWSGTAREATWGFAKLVSKLGATAAVGWIAHLLWEIWKAK